MDKFEVVVAGALVRGRLRRYMTRSGIEFREAWGLIESVFRISGSSEKLDQLRQAFPGD